MIRTNFCCEKSILDQIDISVLESRKISHDGSAIHEPYDDADFNIIPLLHMKIYMTKCCKCFDLKCNLCDEFICFSGADYDHLQLPIYAFAHISSEHLGYFYDRIRFPAQYGYEVSRIVDIKDRVPYICYLRPHNKYEITNDYDQPITMESSYTFINYLRSQTYSCIVCGMNFECLPTGNMYIAHYRTQCSINSLI
jgi:hypothetical protein